MMALRINASHPANCFRGGMDRFLSDVFDCMDPGVGIGRVFRAAFPQVNVREDDRSLYVEADLPGLAMDDIDVSVLGNELTIKGERKQGDEEGVSYHLRERGVGTFHRVVQLPLDVAAQNVSATLRDGVLTVTLPKAESTVPRKIHVRGEE